MRGGVGGREGRGREWSGGGGGSGSGGGGGGGGRHASPRLSHPPHPSGIAVILQTECHALQTADKRDRYHSRLLKEGQRWEREEGEDKKEEAQRTENKRAKSGE